MRNQWREKNTNAGARVYFALARRVISPPPPFFIAVTFLRVSNTHVICRSPGRTVLFARYLFHPYCWAVRWTRGWPTRTTTLSFLSRWTSHDSALKSIRQEFSMAWADANGPRIARSEKIRSVPSYESIFRRYARIISARRHVREYSIK